MDAVTTRVGATVDAAWLMAELRSDHAGETGAVYIYKGILAVTGDPALRQFARAHLATEQQHLELVSGMLDAGDESRLLPLWRLAGFLTGALPALFGPRAVFHTIAAVETFVESHYRAQIEVLAEGGENQLAEQLSSMMFDEVQHRDEALLYAGAAPGHVAHLWQQAVGAGSEFAVAMARRF